MGAEDTEKPEKKELTPSFKRLSREEVVDLVDEMIERINVTFRKEIKDEVTRGNIIHFITQNYGEDFQIDKVQTICEEDINKFKRDCFYWIFILTTPHIPNERIYITI